MLRRIYIHQQDDWPKFTWDDAALLPALGQVRHLQGRLLGRMETLGFELKNEALLDTGTLDVLKTSEIEGEILDMDQVRSSVARRLGMNIPGPKRRDLQVDGVVDMMMDSARNFDKELSPQRLFEWHAGLFPTGKSGNYNILVGQWREGPMQVVSGALGKEKLHFEAPDHELLENEMKVFLQWFNKKDNLDPVIKAGLAHLWFVTLHPFDDGNGRIGRSLTDMLLARGDGSPQRFYSMSARIRVERNQYYDILEKTQQGGMNVTPWLHWFLECLLHALKNSDSLLEKVLFKAAFWQKHAHTELNERQRGMLNRLLDGVEGKLSSSKWGKMAKCSPDTALRDIQDLMQKGILQKESAGGRSTNYELIG